MTRDPRAYLADVIEAGKAIQDAVAAISFDDYCSRRLIRSAVEREFMMIGEALKQLSQRNPKLFASIGKGPEIIGFRNKLKIGHGKLCLHSTWATQADNAAPSGVKASTGIKWHQGLPPRGSLCGNGFRGDASTWPMQSRLHSHGWWFRASPAGILPAPAESGLSGP